MFFVIQKTGSRKHLLKLEALINIRSRILRYRFGATEVLLDRYLQANYQYTLRAACLAIANNMKFQLNSHQELIVTIPNRELNKLATLITYGNELVLGSAILKEALGKENK